MSEEKISYISLMNFISAEEAYEKVRELASSLSDKEHMVRSCIFDLHAVVEVELRRVFYHTFYAQLFLTDDEAANEKAAKELERVIDRLGFLDMFRVLRPVLLSWPYGDFDSIQALNESRNQAAHGDIKKVRYKGRNPFEDGDAFAQMYFDTWAITESMSRFFDNAIEKPKRNIKRYVDKYGPGLLF